ncbi:MAG: contact-dependent growth inhibition system immunity protein [Vicinamibacterales bacterium]
MTRHQHGPLHPDLFPRLAEFAAGYLHQDFPVEHKTPEGALRAYLADVNPDERAELEQELARFRDAAKRATWRDVREAFEALGAAWRPLSRAALDDLLHLPARLTEAARRSER